MKKENIVFYRCAECGEIVVKINDGSCTPLCCGKEMVRLEGKTADAGMEKHVPVIEKKEGALLVKCGDIPHPMIDAHYIEWLAIVTDSGLAIKYLNPGDAPEALFESAEHGIAYSYCNIHGFWKKEF